MTPAPPARRARRKLLGAAARLLHAGGIETPRLDAEILLAFALGASRLDLLIRPDEPVTREARQRFAALVRARAAHEPVAYLVGFREFFGRDFRVDRRVLVPRPETRSWSPPPPLGCMARPATRRRVLDLGTGSGCIAASIACEVPGSEVFATDLSEGALDVARENVVAARAGPHRGPAARRSLRPGRRRVAVRPRRFQPAYVARNEIPAMDRSVRDWEPFSAWLAGEDPVIVHERILRGAAGHLAPDGAVMLEIGSGGAEVVEGAAVPPGCARRDRARSRRHAASRRGRARPRSAVKAPILTDSLPLSPPSVESKATGKRPVLMRRSSANPAPTVRSTKRNRGFGGIQGQRAPDGVF